MEKIIADVAIIGGGVMGCSLAYYLSKRKAKVVLLEKGGIASGASGRAYGMVWISTAKPGLNFEIRKLGQKIYPTLQEELDFDIEFRNYGGLTIALGEKTFEGLRKHAADMVKLGINIITLDGKETRYLEPSLAPTVFGSMFCSWDSMVNPMLVCMGFACAARRQGVKILTESEVEGIIVRDGVVEGVRTKEFKISSPVVVNAAGSWAAKIGKMVGIELPVFPQRLQTLVTSKADFPIRAVLLGAKEVGEGEGEEGEDIVRWASGYLTEEEAMKTEPGLEFYVYPTRHNNFVIGALKNFVGFDTSTNYEGLMIIANNIKKYVPRIGRLDIIRSYAGLLPYSSDTLPFLGFVDEIQGLVLACGHYMGIAQGPGTGLLLSQLILDKRVDIPLDEYSFSRFPRVSA